jgi:hypothetical protein
VMATAVLFLVVEVHLVAMHLMFLIVAFASSHDDVSAWPF